MKTRGKGKHGRGSSRSTEGTATTLDNGASTTPGAVAKSGVRSVTRKLRRPNSASKAIASPGAASSSGNDAEFVVRKSRGRQVRVGKVEEPAPTNTLQVPSGTADDTQPAVGAFRQPGIQNTLSSSDSELSNMGSTEISITSQRADDSRLSGELVPVEAILVEEGDVPAEDREKIKDEIRNEIIQNTVIGAATRLNDKGDDEASGRRKLWIAIAVAILVVAIVVGVVVGTSSSDDPAVVLVTESPSASAVPSSSPTGPTDAPSAIPSFQPSTMPTVSIANLANFHVEEAHPLVLKTDPLTFSFPMLIPPTEYIIYCGSLTFASTSGYWYVYRARKSGPVSVVVCGNASIRAFKLRSSQTMTFDCVEHYQSGDVDGCGGDSVTLHAQAGEEYHFLVESSALPAEELTIKVVDNDHCQHAYGPLILTSVGTVVTYSTSEASMDSEVGACGTSSASVGPGVWYKVTGTGQPITATTCSDKTTFDTQISVFEGSCGGLVCRRGNNDFDCGSQSTVTFPSVESEVYHLLVHGNGGASGDFELAISTDAARATNDFCETAQPLLFGAEISFAFSGSSADPNVTPCDDTNFGGNNGFPYGLWFSFFGTGGRDVLTVSWDDKSPVTIYVYVGSCGSPSCVTTNSRILCGGTSTCDLLVSVENSVEGELYSALVATTVVEGIDIQHTLSLDAE